MNTNRKFLADVMKSGLDLGTLTPDDVIRHITPEIIAHHLPVALKARLLEASLAAEKMTAGLIVTTLGVEALAEHSPVGALWGCISEVARRLLGEDEVVASAPAPLPAASAPAAMPAASAPAAMSAAAPAAMPAAAPVPVAVPPEPSGPLSANKIAAAGSQSAAARPSAVRMPGRVSSLSPRSRPPAPPRNGNGRSEVGDELTGLDTRVRADSPDFEIDEEEMKNGIRVGRELKVDEETRPGDITTRKA